MTVSELLEQITSTASETDADYKTAARRWLNLARADVADSCRWKNAMDAKANFDTATATTDGIYDLTGYEYIWGKYLYDQTSDHAIPHESIVTIRSFDPTKEVNGPPIAWGDAGADTTSGARRIYLWPIPDDVRTIAFHGYRQLTDLTSDNDNSTVDPFFGGIINWQACFVAGMRYYQVDDDNESVQHIMGQRGVFQAKIKQRRQQNRMNRATSVRLMPNRPRRVPLGRLDPAHFAN